MAILMKDSQEGQLELAYLFYSSDIGIGSWSVSTYRMSMCSIQVLDRLNTEGGMQRPCFTADAWLPPSAVSLRCLK